MTRVKDLSDENIVKALHNVIADRDTDDISLTEFLEYPLDALFNWESSPEGHQYLSLIHI